MTRITPQNALKLSAWIAANHPGLFRQLLQTTQALQRSPLGRLGLFGDDVSLSDVSVDVPDVTMDTSTAVDAASFSPDLTDIGIDSASLGGDVSQSTSDAITSAIAAPVGDSPNTDSNSSSSFWGSVGSGVSSVAGAVGKVASALLSPQTMTAAGTAAAAYFRSQATTAQAQSQAQTQQAILNAQLARVGQGSAPAPISYVTNPATGQLMPVYASTSGYQPVTPSLLSQLMSPSAAGIAGIPTPLLLIGGGFLVLSLLLSARARSP